MFDRLPTSTTEHPTNQLDLLWEIDHLEEFKEGLIRVALGRITKYDTLKRDLEELYWKANRIQCELTERASKGEIVSN